MVHLLEHGAITTAIPVAPVVAEEGDYDPNLQVANPIPVNYAVARHLENMEPVVEAMDVQPKQKGCWGRFCQTIKRMATRRGGRKTKRLRKKYKKTRNIKKKQIKKNDV